MAQRHSITCLALMMPCWYPHPLWLILCTLHLLRLHFLTSFSLWPCSWPIMASSCIHGTRKMMVLFLEASSSSVMLSYFPSAPLADAHSINLLSIPLLVVHPFTYGLISTLCVNGLWRLLLSCQGGSSHRTRGRSGSRLISVVEESVEAYHAHTPPDIRAEIDLVEADVCVLRHFIPDEEVLHSTNSWIPDTGNTRAQILNI
jgi:hypothetical protein